MPRLRRAYAGQLLQPVRSAQQSVFRTCLKLSILGFCYALLLIVGGGLTLVAAVLLS